MTIYKTQITALALLAFVVFGSVMPTFASHDNNDEEASCWISAHPDEVYKGGTVTLSWGSQHADEAWISDIGSVGTSGSRIVRVSEDTTFTLTVENDEGTAECETEVNVRSSGHTSYYDKPGCSIYRERTWDGGAILRWSSTDASSAYLSNVGSVALFGSYAVPASYDRTYTLTVYGNGQSESCEVHVSGGTGSYHYPQYTYPHYPQYTQYPTQYSSAYPYISLSQIPYTGVDLGAAGSILYFAALLSFALAGGYLMVYFNGGVMRRSFAGEVKMAARNQFTAIRSLFS